MGVFVVPIGVLAFCAPDAADVGDDVAGLAFVWPIGAFFCPTGVLVEPIGVFLAAGAPPVAAAGFLACAGAGALDAAAGLDGAAEVPLAFFGVAVRGAGLGR